MREIRGHGGTRLRTSHECDDPRQPLLVEELVLVLVRRWVAELASEEARLGAEMLRPLIKPDLGVFDLTSPVELSMPKIGLPEADASYDIAARGVYSLNSKTVEMKKDGSATIQFGDREGISNCLEIMDAWNYAIRMYQPQESILIGTWKFPKPLPR